MEIINKHIINENQLYYDLETDEILTELEMYMYYLDTDQSISFWRYLLNCTDKNGFLEEISNTKKYKYQEETTIILTERQWLEFYERNIDKKEYPTFKCWWIDMLKMDLIKGV